MGLAWAREVPGATVSWQAHNAKCLIVRTITHFARHLRTIRKKSLRLCAHAVTVVNVEQQGYMYKEVKSACMQSTDTAVPVPRGQVGELALLQKPEGGADKTAQSSPRPGSTVTPLDAERPFEKT